MTTKLTITLLLILSSIMTAARADQPVSVPVPDHSPSKSGTTGAYVVNGSIDVGALHDSLTGGFPDWNGDFIRGVVHTSASNTVNMEINQLSEFGDTGQLYSVGDTVDINAHWYNSIAVQGSSGGFFLPQKRVDLFLNRKWLKELNFITSVGLSEIDAKDDHVDRAVQLGAVYYFTAPWVIEGGYRVNKSNPGNVIAPSSFIATTYGREKVGLMTVRYGWGRESYQLIGVSSTLVDFASSSTLLTWRQWIGKSWGTQLRAEHYQNPTYYRDGVEAGLFVDF